MSSLDYRNEERNREPSQFGITLNKSELTSWRKAAIIEVIEMGVRKALDLSATRSLKKLSETIELLIALHELLLDPLNHVCKSVLSSCKQSKDLAEIVSYLLLNTVLQLSIKADIRGEKYAATMMVAKEMCVCLATALPNDLHILDEILSILFYSKNHLHLHNTHFLRNPPFVPHFQNELSFSVSMYVGNYCDDNFDEMGTKSKYDMSTWSKKKLDDLRKANSENSQEFNEVKVEKNDIKRSEGVVLDSESLDYIFF